jgi:D-serine deaminase-like pyridoxal phosphate-dependent protein
MHGCNASYCFQGGYGHILGHPELTLLSASQEQSIIEYSGPANDIQKSFYDLLPIGGLVKIVPNHACLTAACHAEYLILDDKDAIVDRWQPCKGW